MRRVNSPAYGGGSTSPAASVSLVLSHAPLRGGLTLRGFKMTVKIMYPTTGGASYPQHTDGYSLRFLSYPETGGVYAVLSILKASPERVSFNIFDTAHLGGTPFYPNHLGECTSDFPCCRGDSGVLSYRMYDNPQDEGDSDATFILDLRFAPPEGIDPKTLLVRDADHPDGVWFAIGANYWVHNHHPRRGGKFHLPIWGARELWYHLGQYLRWGEGDTVTIETTYYGGDDYDTTLYGVVILPRWAASHLWGTLGHELRRVN
jgi:hypothetical protein